MKKLLDFLENLHKGKQFEITTFQTVSEMNDEVIEFIEKTYPRIKKDNYVTLTFDPTFGKLHVQIKPEFEDELKEYYPEQLI